MTWFIWNEIFLLISLVVTNDQIQAVKFLNMKLTTLLQGICRKSSSNTAILAIAFKNKKIKDLATIDL